eukprot:gene16094-33791_t
MNLPLYSPTAPCAGRKPGWGRKAEAVHCQQSPNNPALDPFGCTAAAPSSCAPVTAKPSQPLPLPITPKARPPTSSSCATRTSWTGWRLDLKLSPERRLALQTVQ